MTVVRMITQLHNLYRESSDTVFVFYLTSGAKLSGRITYDNAPTTWHANEIIVTERRATTTATHRIDATAVVAWTAIT